MIRVLSLSLLLAAGFIAGTACAAAGPEAQSANSGGVIEPPAPGAHLYLAPFTSLFTQSIPPLGFGIVASERLSLGANLTLIGPGQSTYSRPPMITILGIEGTYWLGTRPFTDGWGLTPFISAWSKFDIITAGGTIAYHWFLDSGPSLSLGAGLSHMLRSDNDKWHRKISRVYREGVGPEVTVRIGWAL